MEMTTKQRFKLNLAVSTDSDNDWEKTWIVIPASLGLSDQEIGERWTHNPEGDYCQHSYDCCGNWYASAIRIKRVNQRVLVTQNHYRNV